MRRALLHCKYSVKHKRAQENHGEVVDELEVLAKRGVEDERTNAKDEEGNGHEVILREKKPRLPGPYIYR